MTQVLLTYEGDAGRAASLHHRVRQACADAGTMVVAADGSPARHHARFDSDDTGATLVCIAAPLEDCEVLLLPTTENGQAHMVIRPL